MKILIQISIAFFVAFQLYADNSYVFPGDCNNDGIVDLSDVSYNSFLIGSVGPPRPNATTDCSLQLAPDWSIIIAGINAKHSDCDGNGIIDNIDHQIILMNYGCQDNAPSCHIDDWTALKALYESTDGDNWNNNTGWEQVTGTTPPTDCDLRSMHGVAVDNGRVNWLNLSHNQLSGSIPAELGNLSNLTYLVLPNNQLSSNIPPELVNSSNLTSLSLGNNQLNGNIPIEISNLDNLANLSLSNNQLSGSIPVELGNLYNMIYLSLNNNQFSGNIPPQLGNLANLKDLRLHNNQLNGSIPVELGNLSTLTYLTLENNQLNGCYNSNLLNLCGQLTNGSNGNISDGNNLNIPWEDFCSTGTGTCVLPSDGVLPGDCNNDGIVGVDDFLHWGNTYGFTGPTRPNATTDCIRQLASDWSGSYNGVNLKHTDCDGNGIIDDADDDIIISNFGCSIPPQPNNVVFPGDCNTDGIVDINDVLFWALAEGFNGSFRLNTTTDCTPQACSNWSQWIAGINGKHQDGDGNGTVDNQDLQVIRNNFGCINNYTAPTYSSGTSVYRLPPQGINNNGKYQYDLYAENGLGAAAIAHGLTFTVSSNVVPISAITVSTMGSSLYPDEEFIFIDGNQCHVVLTRTDGVDVTCVGPIATFTVATTDVPLDIPFDINIAFGSKIKADATFDNITGASAFGMYNGISANVSNLTLNASITHEQCNGFGEAIAIPFGGTTPYTYVWSIGANSPQVSNLASGSYTVTVTDANGLVQSLTLQINGQTPIYDTNGNLLCGSLCPDYLAPSGVTGTGLYSASNGLDSDATIPSGNTTQYKAGQVVKLDKGFTVQPNARFSAEIEGCNEN